MLHTLSIDNFITIDHLKVDFQQGFTSLTGETGAGKSVFVGALSLLLGKRAETSSIRFGKNKCVIEATFRQLPPHAKKLIAEQDLEGEDPDECIVRREIISSGKNRCFVNDTPLPLSSLSHITELLIDIHSQHSNLLLRDDAFIRKAVDRTLPDANILDVYHSVYNRFVETRQRFQDLLQLQRTYEETVDFDSFRYQELCEANLAVGEEEFLFEKIGILQNAAKIKTNLSEAMEILNADERGIADTLISLKRKLTQVCKSYSAVQEYIDRIESIHIELMDITSDLSSHCDSIEEDPLALQNAEERMDLLGKLFTKYRVDSSNALIALRDELAQKLTDTRDLSETIQETEKELEKSRKELDKVAQSLRKQRQEAARKMVDQLNQVISELDLSKSKVILDIRPLEEPQFNGADKITLLFSSSKVMKPQPVGEIASGGEISRLMLALKAILAEHEKLPTIFFDEIDTGVSGRVADKMGIILKNLGKVMQVIAITHLPQIAARGTHQLAIEKEISTEGEPKTNVKKLSTTERQIEVARLISGNIITETGLQAAKELLDNDN